MTMAKALILGLFGLAATGAVAQDTAIPSSEAVEEAAPAPDPKLQALAACTAHIFETIVTIEGRRRGSKVKICGEPGQSDAEWLNTLRDSVRKTEADAAMAPALRAQIMTALKAEISRLEAGASTPVNLPATRVAGLSNELLPPAQPAPQYSVVPPLPAPLPRAGTAAAAASSVAAAPAIRPRLTIRCALPRESFGGCSSLVRETQVLIRADEDIAPKTSVRFLRGGDLRAELDLSALKKGETMREKLPTRVCSGVLRGKVQIQVLNAGKVTDTLGPYGLYCGS
jgi:hypothetical protein